MHRSNNPEESGQYALARWFECPLGRYVLAEERTLLEAALPMLFGYFLVQSGCWGLPKELLDASAIRSRYIIDHCGIDRPGRNANFAGEAHCLALRSDAVDAMLLPHTLEHTPDPRQALREVERVLMAGGQVVIFGFNPWSAWGLMRRVWPGAAVWGGRGISVARLSDWLRVLGFEILNVRRYLFRPPHRAFVSERMAFLDGLSRLNISPLAGGYMVVAKKRVACITPLKFAGRRRNRAALGGFEPTTRSSI
jgi:SAM-dependent methyltransferase